jgi:anaerobic dimethyl sulfoxide reductase subunit B (iron-sulfur subunit)
MRYAFYFDSTRCVGCKTCAVACKKKNNLPMGIFYRKVDSYEVGEYPSATFYHFSHACNHCNNPACTRACPTAAMYKAEDGTVQHDDDQCIGCGSCVIACPYDAPVIVPELGIAKKCNACADTRDEDGSPVCVAACGMRALDFGPYDEMVKKHPDMVNKIAPMPTPDITDPSILIKARDVAFDEGYREMKL